LNLLKCELYIAFRTVC